MSIQSLSEDTYPNVAFFGLIQELAVRLGEPLEGGSSADCMGKAAQGEGCASTKFKRGGKYQIQLNKMTRLCSLASINWSIFSVCPSRSVQNTWITV